AWLTNLKGSPLVPDAAFLHALPETLQKICTGLKLQSPIGMLVQMLFIDMPGEPNIPPIIYWDGGLAMQDAKLETGVPLEHVNGQVWCRGRHNGHHLEGVNGNLLLDQAI